MIFCSLVRLFGSNNKEEVLSHPHAFEEQMRTLLEPYGIYTKEIKSEVERVRDELTEFVNGPLQDIEEIEKTTEAIGCPQSSPKVHKKGTKLLPKITTFLSRFA